MRTIRIAALLAVLPLAAGCVFVKPQAIVPNGAPLLRTSGYVGGLFHKDSIVGFGFVVRDERSQEEYVLEIKNKSAETINVIALPPGRYRVASWVTWATLTTEQLTRQDISASSPLARPFDLDAGQVMLLGSWSADREMYYGGNLFTIVPKPVTQADLVKVLEDAYPRFTDAKVRCLLCVR